MKVSSLCLQLMLGKCIVRHVVYTLSNLVVLHRTKSSVSASSPPVNFHSFLQDESMLDIDPESRRVLSAGPMVDNLTGMYALQLLRSDTTAYLDLSRFASLTACARLCVI